MLDLLRLIPELSPSRATRVVLYQHPHTRLYARADTDSTDHLWEACNVCRDLSRSGSARGHGEPIGRAVSAP